jgi:hypothetical protein
MEAKPKGEMVIVIPYHLGPSIRNFAIPLLYSGTLVGAWPAYFNPKVLEVFYGSGDWLAERKDPLLNTFELVRHHYELLQTQAIDEAKHLAPLGKRICKATLVYSGTPEWYAEQAPHREPVLKAAILAITADPQLMNVAASEFVWRLFEAYLELGEDLDQACGLLYQRAVDLGGPLPLLAECFLNRSTLVRDSKEVSYVTDDPSITDLLKPIGTTLIDDVPTKEIRSELLAYMLFECLLQRSAPRLLPDEVSRLATLMEDHSSELTRMRRRCLEEASILVDKAPSEKELQNATTETLRRFEEEVSDILSLTRSSVRDAVAATTENYAFWAAIAGLVGSLLGGLDSAVPATLAATALSVFGSSALKMSREQRARLAKSPWTFIYRLGTSK